MSATSEDPGQLRHIWGSDLGDEQQGEAKVGVCEQVLLRAGRPPAWLRPDKRRESLCRWHSVPY